MPNITQIVIADGKGTPVNHTFKVRNIAPTSGRGETSTLQEDAAVALGNSTLLLSMKDPSQNGSVYALEWQLSVPALVDETVNGVTRKVISHTPRATGVFFLPVLSSTAERRDLRVLVSNLMKDPVLTAMIENLEHCW